MTDPTMDNTDNTGGPDNTVDSDGAVGSGNAVGSNDTVGPDSDSGPGGAVGPEGVRRPDQGGPAGPSEPADYSGASGHSGHFGHSDQTGHPDPFGHSGQSGHPDHHGQTGHLEGTVFGAPASHHTSSHGPGPAHPSAYGPASGLGPSGWRPTPQSGEYDADATAFVQLPEGLDLSGTGDPLAAPGHDYVPPHITAPLETGTWNVHLHTAPQPYQPLPYQPQPHEGPQHGSQQHDFPRHGPQPTAQQPHEQHQPYEPQQSSSGWPVAGHDAGTTSQWNFTDAFGAAPSASDAATTSSQDSAHAHQLTGQWTIPAAEDESPDDSGEFPVATAAPWHAPGTPTTLPGGASAPWALPPEQPTAPTEAPGASSNDAPSSDAVTTGAAPMDTDSTDGAESQRPQPGPSEDGGAHPSPVAEVGVEPPAHDGSPRQGGAALASGDGSHPGGAENGIPRQGGPAFAEGDGSYQDPAGAPGPGTDSAPEPNPAAAAAVDADEDVSAPPAPETDGDRDEAPGIPAARDDEAPTAAAPPTGFRPEAPRVGGLHPEAPQAADGGPDGAPTTEASVSGTPTAGNPSPGAPADGVRPVGNPSDEAGTAGPADGAAAAPPAEVRADVRADVPEPSTGQAAATGPLVGGTHGADGGDDADTHPDPDPHTASHPGPGTDRVPDTDAAPGTGPGQELDPAHELEPEHGADQGHGLHPEAVVVAGAGAGGVAAAGAVADIEPSYAAPHEPPPYRDEPSEHPHASYVLRVNGADRPVTEAWIGESLLYVLRERLGLAGAKDGCSQGECGACAVQVDGRLVASCLVPAATTAGSEVRTVEGLATDGEPSDVQRALAGCGAVQCGFCIPGMAMTVHDLLEGNHAPSELETRQALCGNLCRCSGYHGVLAAVREVVAEREAAADATTAHHVPHDEARIPHQAPPGAGGAQHTPHHPHDGGMA
ncbi:2Fe-2S iron-sulfur cluster-binding protein [Streptomyces candidus]|uniref:Aerobic-type carbon monoxide dehydrogenase small subunit (CoxS/CutS family) n=1 Tax=Streptomyces candidus TaxID=67283 RepID=A0A7X0HIB9_9ACTN|nr:2Fe-2S iron-sulfur cluster-binding protein [Streptomyces candidus]MBB6436879.1 aerobic-type carbon monoxide dehydrogenase small subunit (CoxS/CutS family) [Streptomyces candidus]GHH32103.1 hypothetical protein GCM10018773_00600 [Streptomyces candidus]